MTKKIFISGPMTGYEDYNFPRFLKKEQELKEDGWEVVNPVHICRKYKREVVLSNPSVFNKMVKEELKELIHCDAIYLLDGWNLSVGARDELKRALRLGLEILVETK